MKRIAAVLIIISASAAISFAGDDALQKAVKLLSQSAEEGCGICAEDLAKKAVKTLNQGFAPGQEIQADALSFFMTTGDCANNEFVLSSYPGRGVLTPSDKVNPDYPLVTYRIHTDNDHLAGVKKEDYTDASLARPFMKGFAKKSWKGAGVIRLIAYPYGDGKCFIYFPKTKKIQFQCRVVSEKQLTR